MTFDVRTSRDSLDASGPNGGDPIVHWKYRIDRDNTGDPFADVADCEADDPASPGNPDTGAPSFGFPVNFPDNCAWQSMQSFMPGNHTADGSPIVTQGDETDFEPTGMFSAGIDLANGKYLISVTADGHKIGGANFTIDAATPANQTITVLLDPYPLPLVTLRARVFNDISTNGQIDYPAEGVPAGATAPDWSADGGMAGFTATINDWAAEVTTDWYGNALCTEYVTTTGSQDDPLVLDPDGNPQAIEGTGGQCVSDYNGDIVLRNLGPNRYAMTIAPPADDPSWIQTTTLEGGLDWDIWAMEGYTGFDTEFNVGGEAVPWVNFGYVRERAAVGAPSSPLYYTLGDAGTGAITGVVGHYDAYTPSVGQGPATGDTWGGYSGTKITGPIENPVIALVDLQDGDRAIWIGEGDENGKFTITGVRDGEYQVTIWEKNLLTLLDFFQVTVTNGEVVDIGVVGLTGWFANFHGTVFLDHNENGRQDPGEPGVPNMGLTLRGRENNVVENGQNATTSGPDGAYEFENAYPYTMWVVMEAYSDRFHTTGITYQASNQNTPTTVRGGGVDINVLPIIGQTMRIDWGVVPYKKDENGSIAGSVFSDTTINELDARLAAVEDWSTGVPGITVNAYTAVSDGVGGWTKGVLVDTTTTETWGRPGVCTARDAAGDPIVDQLVFPYDTGNCIEAPLTGIQVDPMADGEGGFGARVNGNFGFGTLAAGKYIVELDIPNDDHGRPLYKVEDEESVNVFAGDVYTAQNNPNPDAGGVFDFGGQMDTGLLPISDPATQAPSAAAVCVGASHVVNILENQIGSALPNPRANAPFADAGGTPYQGVSMPGCEAKLIEVVDGRSVAPAFTLYNDVPPPAHFWGYTVDDLNVDTNPRRASFGEVRGLSYSPTGVYNWAGRLITQVNADANGIWEVLVPSTTTMNCPSPAGVCPGMYRFVGNDPGTPSAPFRGYNPSYRTIAANFQAWPGVNTIADTAPTQVGASIQAPGGAFNALSVCAAEDTRPHVFRVNRPYSVMGNLGTPLDLVIDGVGFGTLKGELRLVDVDTDSVQHVFDLSTVTWSATQISTTIPNDGSVRAGVYQIEIVRPDGVRPVNTVSYHVVGAGYNPRILEVGPGKTFDPNDPAKPANRRSLQSAIDRYRNPGNRGVLVVVYPNTISDTNLDGAYYENLIISTPVTVQGVGAGGPGVPGTVLHGGNFWATGYDPTQPFTSVELIADAWYTKLGGINWQGNQNIADGSVVYVISGVAANGSPYFTSRRVARLDGLKITGGDQRDFPGNIQQIGGIVTPTGAANAQTQGGGVFLNGFTPNFHITNNVLTTNGGAYGGAIRVGTPFSGDNQNDDLVIAHNRIVANGGSQLAGAVALFNGAERYVVSDNDICGNSSTEYGGGISHYGYSPGGRIEHNRITLNSSYDEGGGVMIGGELPADPTQLSQGAGSVAVRNNVISANLANDDGGGLRFLQAGNFRFDVTNNMITNNVSTHQGGGIALNDAPDVRIVNNTVAHNITTATAITSDGLPAPAGLSTTGHSAQMQAALPATADAFSNPLLENNIFYDNRAGTWAGTAGIIGIGQAGDATDVYNWDIGASDGSGDPTVSYSLVQAPLGTVDGGSNIGGDPIFVNPKVTQVAAYTWRNYQRFRSAVILSYDVTQSPIGDDHLQGASPAIDVGTIGAEFDIDNETRPMGIGWDMGADEVTAAVTYGPFTGVLDDFERGAGNNANINIGLSPAWWSGSTANSRARILNFPTTDNRALATWRNGTLTWVGDDEFGDSQEAYVTFLRTPTLNSRSGLFLAATGLRANGLFQRASSYVEVAYNPVAGGIQVRTKRAGFRSSNLRAVLPAPFSSGDSLLARINVNGDLEVYKQPDGSPWELLGVVELGFGAQAWPVPDTPAGGRIGINSSGNVRPARLDNFGGGEVR